MELKTTASAFTVEEGRELLLRNAIICFKRLAGATRAAQAQVYAYGIALRMNAIKTKRIAMNRRLISRQRQRRNK